jgi:hypothetical protein
MNLTRLQLRAQGSRFSDREAVRNALWSFHFHGAGLDPSMVPENLRPMPITEAMEAASRWDDEHAYDRRIRSLRRLNPEFLRKAEKPSTLAVKKRQLEAAAKRALESARRDAEGLSRRVGQTFRAGLPPTRDVFSKLEPPRTNAASGEARHRNPARCIPQVDKPGLDPERGRTFLHSVFHVQQALKPALAYLLDPRNWDECSDLFDLTYRIAQPRGGDDGKPPPELRSDPDLPGTDWKGYLYELAGVGPQVVENILNIDFKVKRTCSGAGAKRSLKCKEGLCHHALTEVNVDYGLHESLSYEIGGIQFPGLMRQNHGYFRAKPAPNDRTEISVTKTIRFARLTDWSTGAGVFDLGEILNYTAPAYLSLWIYDVTQVVPCCEHLKHKP